MQKTIDINELIKILEQERNNGGKTVGYEGTVLVVETGNSIIITTKKQY